jgi:hypothetical protein
MEVVSAHARDVIVEVAFSKTELEMLNEAFGRMHMIEDGRFPEAIKFLKEDLPEFIKQSLEALKQSGY